MPKVFIMINKIIPKVLTKIYIFPLKSLVV